MSDLTVGSTIWTINPRDRREGWQKHLISGETKFSWLVQVYDWAKPRKIVKSTMLENHGPQWGHQRWYSTAAMVERQFIDRNRHHIAKLVGVEEDAAKLKQIAEILGMELTCNPPS